MTVRPAAMVLVRSQIGNGRLESIDTEFASAQPGVLAVLTHADVTPASVASGRPVLARDVIAFQGQELAAVVAENDYLAADAAEQVDVVVDSDQADVDDAPVADTAPADGSVSCTLTHQRWHPVALQTQQCVATPLDDDRVRVRVAVRDHQSFAGALAAALGIPASAVEVEAPADAGRAAMTADLLCPGHVLAAASARRLGRAVRWQESRSDSLTSGGAQAGFVARGRCTGTPGDPGARLDLHVLADVGAYALPGSVEPSSWSGLPWYGAGRLTVEVVERSGHLPPAARDSVPLIGQVAMTELLIGAVARTSGADRAALQREWATAGGVQAATLLEAARATVGAAVGETTGTSQARGAALAPGLAAGVRVDLDCATGEWRVDRVAIATSFALSRAARLAISAGAVDGYGLAAMQEISFDDQGNCLAATLMDYVMPSSWEAPVVELSELADATSAAPPNDISRLLATAAVAAAARNAVAALVPGLDATPTPLTSAAVWDKAAACR